MTTTLRLNKARFGIVPNTGLEVLTEGIERLRKELHNLGYDHKIVSLFSFSSKPDPSFTLSLPSPDHEGEKLYITFRTDNCGFNLDSSGNYYDPCTHQEGLAKMVEALQKAGVDINRHEMPKRFVMIIHRKPEPEPETQPPANPSA